jgi:hypothetical protein
MEKKKDIAALIVEGLPSPEKEGESESMESEASDVEVAAQEVMDAFASKDAASLAESLKSFIKLCEYEKDEEESSEVEGE